MQRALRSELKRMQAERAGLRRYREVMEQQLVSLQQQLEREEKRDVQAELRRRAKDTAAATERAAARSTTRVAANEGAAQLAGQSAERLRITDNSGGRGGMCDTSGELATSGSLGTSNPLGTMDHLDDQDLLDAAGCGASDGGQLDGWRAEAARERLAACCHGLRSQIAAQRRALHQTLSEAEVLQDLLDRAAVTSVGHATAACRSAGMSHADDGLNGATPAKAPRGSESTPNVLNRVRAQAKPHHSWGLPKGATRTAAKVCPHATAKTAAQTAALTAAHATAQTPAHSTAQPLRDAWARHDKLTTLLSGLQAEGMHNTRRIEELMPEVAQMAGELEQLRALVHSTLGYTPT